MRKQAHRRSLVVITARRLRLGNTAATNSLTSITFIISFASIASCRLTLGDRRSILSSLAFEIAPLSVLPPLPFQNRAAMIELGRPARPLIEPAWLIYSPVLTATPASLPIGFKCTITAKTRRHRALSARHYEASSTRIIATVTVITRAYNDPA